MEIKTVLIAAFFITIAIFLSFIALGNAMDNEREQFINEETQKTYNSLNEMQTFLLMSETYGDRMACLASENKLKDLDETVWNLGIKLDQYRSASEEFVKSPFYKEQKVTFNENEVFYMMLLQKLKTTCSYDQVIMAYFYSNKEDCPKCDDQAFVLTDVNDDLDQEVSIFSYDTDLNITTVTLLQEYYNVTELPCVVIEGEAFCGIRDRTFILEQICMDAPNSTACGLAQSSS
jgi:hypothetical protein